MKHNKKYIKKHLIEPNFITGFANADGSFQIVINRVNTMKYKYRVTPLFVLTQMDRSLLDEINEYFGNRGHLVLDKRSKTWNLRFNSRDAIKTHIIPHFDKYNLKGKKAFDYEKWKYITECMENDKIHLSHMGIAQIAKLSNYSKQGSKIKDHIIRNLTNQLKQRIPDLPFKSKIKTNLEIDPWFVTGMIQGDGTLYVVFPEEHTNFAIGQEIESIDILKSLQIYFKDVGHIYEINETYYRYMIYKKEDILKVLIPHLEKYPLYSKKGTDFKKLITFTQDPLSVDKSEIYYLSFDGKRRRGEGIV